MLFFSVNRENSIQQILSVLQYFSRSHNGIPQKAQRNESAISEHS